MRRGERAVYLLVGAAFTPFASALFATRRRSSLRELPIILALAIVAVVANVSVVQRLAAIIAALRARDKAPAAPPAADVRSPRRPIDRRAGRLAREL